MAFDTNLIESTFLKLRYVPLIGIPMWRSRYGWSYFGLVKPKYISDIIIGLGLWLIIMTLVLLGFAWWLIHDFPTTFPLP